MVAGLMRNGRPLLRWSAVGQSCVLLARERLGGRTSHPSGERRRRKRSLAVRGDRRTWMADCSSDGRGVSPLLVHPKRSWSTERSARADAALEGGERLVEGPGYSLDVPVVDKTAVKLAAQLAEETGPVA